MGKIKHADVSTELTKAEWEAGSTHLIGDVADLSVVRTATLVVAASDASAQSKAQADRVCDGTADEVDVQWAVDALPASGGLVQLSEGTFTWAEAVNVRKSNVILAGMGRASAISYSGSNAVFYLGPTQAAASGGSRYNNITVRDLRFESDGASVDNHFLAVNGVVNFRLENCSFYQSGDEAVELSYCENGVIRGNDFSDCSKADAAGASIYLKHSTYGIVIAENILTNTLASRQLIIIRELTENDTTERIRIIGNTMESVYVCMTIHATTYATSIIRDISILGNTVDNGSGTKGMGINDDGTGVTSDITIMGNIIANCGTALDLNGAANVVIIGNDFRNNTTVIANSAAGNIIRDNPGYITENSGTDAIASGQTTKVVTHGLAATPTVVNIAFREQGTNDFGRWWVDTIGATNFTLNVSADPGASNLDFSWEAKIR